MTADGSHKKTCPLCEAMCGLNVQVENGRVSKIRPNADDVTRPRPGTGPAPGAALPSTRGSRAWNPACPGSRPFRSQRRRVFLHGAGMGETASWR